MTRARGDDPIIANLCEVLLEAINDFAEDHRVTTGQAMGALFIVMVEAAKASPEYDPKQLIAEVDARIREAVHLN